MMNYAFQEQLFPPLTPEFIATFGARPYRYIPRKAQTMTTYTPAQLHKQAGKLAAYAFKAGNRKLAAKHITLAALFLKLGRKWDWSNLQ